MSETTTITLNQDVPSDIAKKLWENVRSVTQPLQADLDGKPGNKMIVATRDAAKVQKKVRDRLSRNPDPKMQRGLDYLTIK